MGSEAEVVATSRPEVPPCPEMWVVQFWDPVPKQWRISVEFYDRDSVGRSGAWGYQPNRLIRIPSEPPATKRGDPCGCAIVCSKCCPVTTKESPCSSGSQGGGNGPVAPSGGTTTDHTTSSATSAPAAAVAANPPAWATPQILAACKPGERLRYRKRNNLVQVRAYPSKQVWRNGELDHVETFNSEGDCDRIGDELYTIPTTPPDKPKPDDAEEVARKIRRALEEASGAHPIVTHEQALRNATDIIRADRQKHADLTGKVRELCELLRDCRYAKQCVMCQMRAREVLAMMEER